MGAHTSKSSAMGAGGSTTVTENSLSSMQGTEKQIKYANDIKKDVTDNMSLILPRRIRTVLTDEVFPALNDSKFWIENQERIRSGLIYPTRSLSDREAANLISQTVNWMFEQAIIKNPSLEKYRKKK